jgi:hypothetical protein
MSSPVVAAHAKVPVTFFVAYITFAVLLVWYDTSDVNRLSLPYIACTLIGAGIRAVMTVALTGAFIGFLLK